MRYLLTSNIDPVPRRVAARRPAASRDGPLRLLHDRARRVRRLRGAEHLLPADTATTVRNRDGETLLTDGPYADVVETFGGYWIVESPISTALWSTLGLPGGRRRLGRGARHRRARLTPADRASPVEVTVDAVYRAHWPLLVASLARWTGDLDRAEEAPRRRWPPPARAGRATAVPDEPAAWLQTTARRRVLDRLRRDSVARDKLAVLAHELRDVPPADSELDPDDPFAPVAWSDEAAEDLLRLVFTCCHPALAPSAQVPLALRLLCGLTPARPPGCCRPRADRGAAPRPGQAEDPDAGIALTVPPRSSWSERLEGVLAVVGLVFTEGHARRRAAPCCARRCATRRCGWQRCCTGCCPTSRRCSACGPCCC
jgi:DNA-directed RNA polymerase specialized sigma24 family protein